MFDDLFSFSIFCFWLIVGILATACAFIDYRKREKERKERDIESAKSSELRRALNAMNVDDIRWYGEQLRLIQEK